MSVFCRQLFICGALLIAYSACELTDDIYHHGKGSVHGTLVSGGAVVSGAEVNWVGAEFDSAPEPSDEDGNFLLTGVPAGQRKLMIRAPDQSLGLRVLVTVVAGNKSELGELELDAAPKLSVTVTDPDLGIEGVKLRLTEIPGLEVESDPSGAAEFPCVPRSGCYTPTADASPYPFAFAADDPACPESEADWQAGLHLTPEQNDGNSLLAQVHNAYAALQEQLEPLSDCDSGCFLPGFWLQQDGPPCPWPIDDIHETDEVLLENLSKTVDRLTALDRFSEGKWSKLACPAPGTWDSTCSIQGRCLPASLTGVGSATVMKSGTATKTCFPTFNGLVIILDSDLDNLANCLDPKLLPLDGDKKYIFVALNVPAWPEDALLTRNGQDYDLYLRAELPLDPASRGYEPEMVTWALIRLDFPDPAPTDPLIRVHLAWIYPVE